MPQAALLWVLGCPTVPVSAVLALGSDSCTKPLGAQAYIPLQISFADDFLLCILISFFISISTENREPLAVARVCEFPSTQLLSAASTWAKPP